MLPAPDDYWSIREKFSDAPARFEVVVSVIYKQVLTAGDCAIDCGAHTGKHTIPLGRAVGPGGRIIAIEPIDEKRTKLKNRVVSEGLADVVQVVAGCVGNEVGVASFIYVANDPGKSAMHLRADLKNDDQKMGTASQRTVPITRIDDMAELSRLRFIKIDVEGAELSVLKGALETLKRHRPIIHFEMGLPSLEAFGVKPEEIRILLKSLSYNIYDIIGNCVSDFETFSISSMADGIYDYIAIPDEFQDREIVRRSALEVFSVPSHGVPPLT